MTDSILINFKCPECGTIEKMKLSKNVRKEASRHLLKKIRFHNGHLSLYKARAFLFYRFGMRFSDADLLLKEMAEVGQIKTNFGRIEVV